LPLKRPWANSSSTPKAEGRNPLGNLTGCHSRRPGQARNQGVHGGRQHPANRGRNKGTIFRLGYGLEPDKSKDAVTWQPVRRKGDQRETQTNVCAKPYLTGCGGFAKAITTWLTTYWVGRTLSNHVLLTETATRSTGSLHRGQEGCTAWDPHAIRILIYHVSDVPGTNHVGTSPSSAVPAERRSAMGGAA